MAAFYESVKQILSEVDTFLKVTLKDESLSKSTQRERTRILDCIQKLYNEHEVLNPNLEEGSSSSSKGVADESRFTTTSNHSHGSEEDAYSDNIPYTTVKALKDPGMLGYLQKKPTDLLEKFSKSKKYCVLHKNVLYWYKKPGDKKQQGAICLSGLSYKDLTVTDKELVFELASSKRSVQFQADTKEDMEEWRKAIEKAISATEQQTSVVMEELEEDDGGENYEDLNEVSEAVKKMSKPIAMSAPISPPPKKLPPLPSQPTTPASPSEDFYDDGMTELPADDDNLIYEDVSAINDARRTPASNLSTDTKGSLSASQSAVSSSASNADTSNGSRKLSNTGTNNLSSASSPTESKGMKSAAEPPKPPALPPPRMSGSTSSSASQPDTSPPPLPGRGQIASTSLTTNPPLPPPARMQCPAMDTAAARLEEDYENLFYGLWSCVGSTAEELSFEPGSIIHVLNRDLDQDSWWIGEKDGAVGLVPKEYLTPVYEVVAC